MTDLRRQRLPGIALGYIRLRSGKSPTMNLMVGLSFQSQRIWNGIGLSGIVVERLIPAAHVKLGLFIRLWSRRVTRFQPLQRVSPFQCRFTPTTQSFDEHLNVRMPLVLSGVLAFNGWSHTDAE